MEGQMGREVKLKPCPFCGSNNLQVATMYDYPPGNGKGSGVVFCGNKRCGISGPGANGNMRGIDRRAIARWNRRRRDTSGGGR